MAHDQGESKDAKHVWRMMEKIKVCMLVEWDGDRLRARPMNAYAKHEEHAVYFLTDAKGASASLIEDYHKVSLNFAVGTKFLTVSGDASLNNDREKIRELWNVFAQAWWSGPDDRAIRVLRVAPRQAEYWESPGRLVSAVNMTIAAATGTRPGLGKDRRVVLG